MDSHQYRALSDCTDIEHDHTARMCRLTWHYTGGKHYLLSVPAGLPEGLR